MGKLKKIKLWWVLRKRRGYVRLRGELSVFGKKKHSIIRGTLSCIRRLTKSANPMKFFSRKRKHLLKDKEENDPTIMDDNKLLNHGKQRHAAAVEKKKGFCAVYVGPERERFLMKIHYLNHPLVAALLQKCGEEFGFEYSNGLTIPCEVEIFKQLLWLLSKHNSVSFDHLDLDKLLSFDHSTQVINSYDQKKRNPE